MSEFTERVSALERQVVGQRRAIYGLASLLALIVLSAQAAPQKTLRANSVVISGDDPSIRIVESGVTRCVLDANTLVFFGEHGGTALRLNVDAGGSTIALKHQSQRKARAGQEGLFLAARPDGESVVSLLAAQTGAAHLSHSTKDGTEIVVGVPGSGSLVFRRAADGETQFAVTDAKGQNLLNPGVGSR